MKTNDIALLEDDCLDGVVGGRVGVGFVVGPKGEMDDMHFKGKDDDRDEKRHVCKLPVVTETV